MRRQQEKEGGPGEEGGVAWGERVGGCGLSNCTLMTLGLYTGSEGTNVKEGGFGHNLGEGGGGGGWGGQEGVNMKCTLVNSRLCVVPSGKPHSCASPHSEQRHDCDEEEVQQVA